MFIFQGNFENLENFISNLGHQFSIIAVSETWSPNNDKVAINLKPRKAIKIIMVLKESHYKVGVDFTSQKNKPCLN